MHLLKMLLRCINADGCLKKRHAPRCIHKMQAILSVKVCRLRRCFVGVVRVITMVCRLRRWFVCVVRVITMDGRLHAEVLCQCCAGN